MAKNPLKDFYKAPLPQERRDALAQAENESDHALVLIMTSFLDQELEEELKFRLPNHNRTTDLFDFAGPLGSFSAKIKMVYAMGLIGADAFRDMNTLREIRNVFAHSPRILSLSEPAIYDRCLALGGVDRHEIASLIHKSLAEAPSILSRRHFWLNCVWFLVALSERRIDGDHTPRGFAWYRQLALPLPTA